MQETISAAPHIIPLGDSGLLIRFGTTLSETANRRAIGCAQLLTSGETLAGVTEIVPNLVSVLLRYDPRRVGLEALAGEVRLRLGSPMEVATGSVRTIPLQFDGEDLAEVAATLSLTPQTFIAAHNARPLRVLATGFAPGFVYCGFHDEALTLSRRAMVRPIVPAGTVLFAAGQTAIASTPIPTGWHVIGHTDFSNFDPTAPTPTTLAAGDELRFEVVA